MLLAQRPFALLVTIICFGSLSGPSSTHGLAATIQHHQRYSARFVQRPSALLVQWHIALLAQQPSALLDERLSALAGWLAGSLAGWLAEYRLGWLCRNSFQGIPSAWGGVGILIKCFRHAARRRDDAEFGFSSLFIHINHQAQASPPFRLHSIDLQAHRPTDGAQACAKAGQEQRALGQMGNVSDGRLHPQGFTPAAKPGKGCLLLLLFAKPSQQSCSLLHPTERLRQGPAAEPEACTGQWRRGGRTEASQKG